jgi:hypothetical protein
VLDGRVRHDVKAHGVAVGEIRCGLARVSQPMAQLRDGGESHTNSYRKELGMRSNAKAKLELPWEPRWKSWRDGLRHGLVDLAESTLTSAG